MVVNGRVILETTGGKLDEQQAMAATNEVIPTPEGPRNHSLRHHLFTAIKSTIRLFIIIIIINTVFIRRQYVVYVGKSFD